MDKDEALKEFLKALRVAFKTVIIYQPGHTSVVYAVDELKRKIDALLECLNPIKIGFTQQSLHIDDRFLENDKLSQDIAVTFHQRKVKSLEIRQGVDVDELMAFIGTFCLSLKEIAHRGGFKNILGEEDILNVVIEELDYSQLLKGEGEELKDVWSYLLHDALEDEDGEKLDELADNFDRVIFKLNPDEIIQVDQLRENFTRFFSNLREHSEVKYSKCAKDLVRAVIRDKTLSSEAHLERLRSMVAGLPEKELAALLHEEILSNDQFDALGFSLFSRLTGGDQDNKISSHLGQLFQKDLAKGTITKNKDKIKRLLFGPETTLISENYRKALGLLLEGVVYEKKRGFDPRLLFKSYRFLLLNLLDKAYQKEAAADLLGLIYKEWKNIIGENDLDYLRGLLETLHKREQSLSGQPLTLKIEELIAQHVEWTILTGGQMPVLDYFINRFQAGRLEVNLYFQTIFTSQAITPYVLSAFFKFHPDSMLYFNINLQKHASDSKFLGRLIENLQGVDSPLTLAALKSIFGSGNPEIKIQALRAMRNLPRYDRKFLFRLLRQGDLLLKEEALAVLVGFDALRTRALAKFLAIPSVFGLNNRTLLAHLGIVKELRLTQARSLVESLGQRRFVWNKKLREEAQRLLEDWDAGKN